MALADDDQGLMLLGAVLGLLLIPPCMLWRHKVFKSRQDIATELVSVLYERLIWLRVGLELLLCLVIVAGYFVQRSGATPPGVATLLGFLFQFEESAMLWLMWRLTLVPYQYLVQRDDASENQLYLANTIKGGLAIGLLFSILPLAAGLYGWNGMYFWFTDYMIELLCFWWFSFLMGFTCTVLSVVITYTSYKRHQHAKTFVHYGPFLMKITAQAAVVFFVENVFWATPYYLRSISFTYTAVTIGHKPRWCRLLDIFAIAYRGAFAMLLYVPKDFLITADRFLRRLVTRVSRALAPSDAEAGRVGRVDSGAWRDAMDGETVQLMMIGKTKPLSFFTDLPPPRLEERRTFVTTFNCGECTLDMIVDDLGEWIPRDMAVYVIGVQECMIMDQLKEAIRDYLGRESYMCWDDAIGSTVTALGFHGHIGVLVLARVEDVRAGNFMIHESQRQRVARGKNLGVARAQNKGGVGLAFRYHDTTVGVVCVHLASDSKGRSKLKKRLRDARDMLSMTSLTKERYKSLDLQCQQHVTIFLGDMNFRMKRASPKRVVEDLAHICRREKQERYANRRDWRRLAYGSKILTPGQRGGGGMLGRVEEDNPAFTASCSSLCGVSEEGEESLNLYRSEGEWARDRDEEGSAQRTVEMLTDAELEEEGELREDKWEEEVVMVEDEGESSEEEEEDSTLTPEPVQKPRLSLSLAKEQRMVRVTWAHFLRSDELQRCMEAGDIFFNYFEGEIRFPPSYRRIRGPVGDCQDYADPAVIHEAYSIYIKEKSLLKSLLRKGSSSASGLSSARSASATISKPATSSSSALPVLTSGEASSTSESSDPSAAPSAETTVSDLSHPLSTSSDDASSFAPKGPPPALDSSVLDSPVLTQGTTSDASGRTTRIPSYTDRILLHVMPDRRSRVRIDAYDACDAVSCSDHKPVSSIIALTVNTGLTGLGAFRPMIEPRHPLEEESDDEYERWGAGDDEDEETGSTATRPAPPLAVCSVQDAGFYKLEVTNVRVDFAPGYERGFFPFSAKPEYMAVQCPTSYEDPYRDLRRPAYNTQVCRQMSFLTAEARLNPFAYFSMKNMCDVERCGVSFVTCLRPEWGMRAGMYVRSGRVTLGCAALPLTDESGMPLAFQEGVCVPTTFGGVQTGTITCDVRVTQLAVPPKYQGTLFA